MFWSIIFENSSKESPTHPRHGFRTKKLSLSLRNPWLPSLTSNCNNKWGCSRPLCLFGFKAWDKLKNWYFVPEHCSEHSVIRTLGWGHWVGCVWSLSSTTVRRSSVWTWLSLTNPNRFVQLEPKSMRTRENMKFGLNVWLSLHLQRRISPLFICKGLLSPKGPLLSKTNNNMIQTHFFTGK